MKKCASLSALRRIENVTSSRVNVMHLNIIGTSAQLSGAMEPQADTKWSAGASPFRQATAQVLLVRARPPILVDEGDVGRSRGVGKLGALARDVADV